MLANLPAAIAPMGIAERFTHEAQSSSEVQKHALKESVADRLIQTKDKVPETEKNLGSKLKLNKDKNNDQGNAFNQYSEKKEEQPTAAEPVESLESHFNPWTGNLLNIKI